jgi:hypothetical protein
MCYLELFDVMQDLANLIDFQGHGHQLKANYLYKISYWEERCFMCTFNRMLLCSHTYIKICHFEVFTVMISL